MKLTISLLLGIIVCLLFNNKVCAQTIGLSGPTTVVPSGTIVTFTATGESANKYIASVPQNADASYYAVNPGVTCPLWDTLNYFEGTGQPGKFNYKLINTNTVAKTVKLNFTMFIATKTNGSTSFANQNVSYTITIGPAAPVGVDPATLAKISNMGFSTDGITSGSDYYLVEDDIMLSKAYVNDYVLNTPLANVLYDNVNIILPYSSFSSTEWYNSLYYAAMAWNKASNSNIKLHIIIGVNSPLFEVPGRVDITVSASNLPSNVPVISRFINSDGTPGNQILINKDFRYPNTNAAPNAGQSAWNVIQAIGHCLGFKHTSDPGNINSIMKRGTSSSSGFQLSVGDEQMLSTKYPLNSSNQLTPFISGKSPLVVSESATYNVSYYEPGMTYSWRVIGINGTTFDQTYTAMPLLSEESFSAGTYEMQCSMNSPKYGLVTASKIIVVN